MRNSIRDIALFSLVIDCKIRERQLADLKLIMIIKALNN